MLIATAAVASAAVSAEAADTAESSELTPLGAERAGNASGTVPPWTGGITEPPPNYQPGNRHPDPFADDKPLFSITAANMDEHANHLSDGQQALLQAHPSTWHMNVYPTRRSASYPQWVYDAVQANENSAELIREGKGGVRNSAASSPFPLPENGLEVVWNHNLRWRGMYVARTDGVAAVTRRGRYRVVLSAQRMGFPYGLPPQAPVRQRARNILLAIKSKTIAPALLSGNGALLIEPIDQTRSPRKVWLYSRNLRRVFRAPFEGYADPAPNSDDLRTVDDLDLFNGPTDRFDWKLLGKRELYIPYNAYRLHSGEAGYDDILDIHHIHAGLARYERHRVWVVEGTLKEGEAHVYSKRVFYVDEDSWQIAVADSYDANGDLWRINEAHALNYYEVPVHWSTLEVFHDLKARRYLVSGLDNRRNSFEFSEKGDFREFSPNALQYFLR